MVAADRHRPAPPTQPSICPPAPHEVRAGTRFGPEDDQYEVDGELGSGAAARVFACRRLSTGEELAVKAVDLRRLSLLNDSDGHLQRLDREVRILKRLRHGRIVELRSVHRTQHWYFLVMERVWGGELFSHIVRQGCLPESEAQQIFKQLLEGVKYMHSRSVIHRDLKPENILIHTKKDGQILDVKIADFGLSKVICDGASLAKTFVGTPQYWAPEVLRVQRGGGSYGQEADLWGLGAVLFVMLSGRYPFDGRKVPLEQQIQQANFNVKTPRWKGVSEEAKDLIRHLLRVNPTDRLCLDGCLRHPWVTGIPGPLRSFSKGGANTQAPLLPEQSLATSPATGSWSGCGRRSRATAPTENGYAGISAAPTPCAVSSSSSPTQLPCPGRRNRCSSGCSCDRSPTGEFLRTNLEFQRGRTESWVSSGGGSGGGGWGHDDLLGPVDADEDMYRQFSSSSSKAGLGRCEDEDGPAISEDSSLEPVMSDSVEEVEMSSRHSSRHSRSGASQSPTSKAGGSAAKGSGDPKKQKRFAQFRKIWSGWAGWIILAALLADTCCRVCVPQEWRPIARDKSEAPVKPTAADGSCFVNGTRLSPWVNGKKPWLSIDGGLGSISAEDPACKEQETIFRLQELLRLQVSIAGSLEVSMLAFRRADTELAEVARITYEEASDLFKRAATLVSQFGQVARQVSNTVLPDLQLAVEVQEPNLALQLLVMVKSWVADMKRDGEEMNNRYEKLHETVLNLVTRAQRSKAGSDQRLAESVRRSAAAKWAQETRGADTCHSGKASSTPAPVHAAPVSGATDHTQAAASIAGAPVLPQAASGQQTWNHKNPKMQVLFDQLIQLSAAGTDPGAGSGARSAAAAALNGGLLEGPPPMLGGSKSAEVTAGVSVTDEADAWKQDVVELLFMSPGALHGQQHLLPAPDSTNLTDGCDEDEVEEDVVIEDDSEGSDGPSGAAADDSAAVVRYERKSARQQDQAAESSVALLRALRELRRVGSILQGCSLFWTNMDGTVSKLAQMKEHTEALVKFAGSNDRLRERFEVRLQEYSGFWASLERLCRLYAMDHEAASSKMQDFILEVRDMADVVDTASSMYAGASTAAAEAAAEKGKRQAAAAAAAAAHSVSTVVRPASGQESDEVFYEKVDIGDGVQIVVSDSGPEADEH